MSSKGSERDLDQTPTWAVSGVCAVIIVISIILEKVLHKAGKWLTEKHKKALYEALEKVKAELMILGFISLTLVFSQYHIAAICIPENVANTMLPCPAPAKGQPKRRLLSYERRVLAGKSKPTCGEGKVALISVKGLHQIHVLIFFLAVIHVAYSAIVMWLSRYKTRGWKEWEEETSTHNYEFSHDPSRFRLTHETSFVKTHNSFWTKIPIFFYLGCFFRQFYRSVNKSDYLTLRNGFIAVHVAPGSKFNFQRYIKRSLEDDFKIIVGVSPLLWASFVAFLLLNIHGWKTLFWASLIPAVIIIAVGTKLQAILTKMALEIVQRNAVVQGMPLVQGSDKYFWFGRPKLMLQLIHFALFQNAFQITYFLWIWYEDGITYCSYGNQVALVVTKLLLGLALLILCSYVTLPLYALVVQMGSHMKKSIFDEQTTKALEKWHMAAKKKHGDHADRSTRTLGDGLGETPVSASGSPLNSANPQPQRYRSTGHSTQYESYEGADHEEEWTPKPTASSSLIIRVDQSRENNDKNENKTQDFSFIKPSTEKGTRELEMHHN